jgi:hypothetical protein
MTLTCTHENVIFMTRSETDPPTWHCQLCGADFAAVAMPEEAPAEAKADKPAEEPAP